MVEYLYYYFEVYQMKKKIIALFLIVLLVLACSCQKATLEDYKLFRSTPLGISVEYPDYWEKTQDNKNGIVAFVTPTEGYAMIIWIISRFSALLWIWRAKLPTAIM